MPFKIVFTTAARNQLQALEAKGESQNLGKLKRVRKCLALLETNPRHPGLNSHKYHELEGPRGEDVWESYVENKTPAAWRIFWHYGPGQNTVTVVAITPHP